MAEPLNRRLQLVVRNSKDEVDRALRNRFDRLHEEALAIEHEDAKQSGNLGFVAKWIVHATLPYREPRDNPPAWGRRSGDVSLMIQPGYYKKLVRTKSKNGRVKEEEELVSIGYPFGSYPRLLLAWMATEVVKKKEQELLLGTSIAQFMSQIGKHNSSGGTRGTITLLKSQAQRLFSATIAITNDPDAVEWANQGFRLLDGAVMSTFWAPTDPNQLQLFSSRIKLSDRFYESLVNNPVPVDLRIIRGLSRSPMSMDIYCWLTYRSATLQRTTKIPWEALYQQFGSASSMWKFKENFAKSLRDVLVVYRHPKIELDRSGVSVSPAPPSVARAIRPKIA